MRDGALVDIETITKPFHGAVMVRCCTETSKSLAAVENGSADCHLPDAEYNINSTIQLRTRHQYGNNIL